MQSLRMQRLIIALGTLLCLLAASAPAPAYVYDDFDGTAIDTTKWSSLNYTFFSQANGYLNFSSSNGQSGTLKSKNQVSGAFSVSMQYRDFSTNNNIAGEFSGSGPVLWIGYAPSETDKNIVSVYEYQSDDTQGFWAIHNLNGVKTHLGLGVINQQQVNSGWLRIDYDGTQVSLWYDSGNGWTTQDDWTFNPGFVRNPFFAIQGYNPDSNGTLSFKVDQVQVVPVPASLLLLGSGLLGLLALGRRPRQS
jgi:hypothetical protein